MTKEEKENYVKLGRHYYNMTRDDAIEIIKSLKPNMRFDDLGWIYTKQALEMAISALEQNESAEEWYKLFVEKLEEQQPCDAISREAVNTLVDELARAISDERCCIPQRGRSTGDIMHDILDLPSVTPSRHKGHWIIKDRYYHDTITAECSECGREVEIPTCMSELMYNGCPYCLADMRGDTE